VVHTEENLREENAHFPASRDIAVPPVSIALHPFRQNHGKVIALVRGFGRYGGFGRHRGWL
jgi:hypothetical protein